ncbi:MAG: hypothetical protein KDA63_18310 [Planctomycetales bacterium]|nr:hypothetical protein [Planctomycetales bacterium]
MAFAIVGLLAFAAFACDVGYILLSRAQLQNSADASAMAGAWALMHEDRLKGDQAMWAVENAAREEAYNYAFANKVASDHPEVDLNGGNAPTGDVVFGRLNADGSLDTLVSPEEYNAVHVIVERSEDKNGEVSLFFGRVLGRGQAAVRAEATASFRDGITGFKSNSQHPFTSLLPFAMDVDDWRALYGGNGADDWTYDDETGKVVSGDDGVQEAKLFPEKTNGNHITPGNFGTVDIGHSGNSTADLARQILEGVSAADLDYIGGELNIGDTISGDGIQSVDGQDGLILNGDTGLSAGIKDELTAIIGQPRTIPLYDAVQGAGNTTNYHIVGFAGIRIVDVRLTGSKKYITIQPAVVVDGSGVGGDGTSSSYQIYAPVFLVN